MKIALQVHDNADKDQADALKKLLLSESSGEGGEKTPEGSCLLRLDLDGLSLIRNMPDKGESGVSPTRVDFLAADLDHRRRTSGKSSGIGKAVGLHKRAAPEVLDVTAGLGRDAFILAALGCRVTMLERSPLIHALLEDGLRRARVAEDPALALILSRMTLHRADALSWLREIAGGGKPAPDVIYLDPMFPKRGKQAKVKKDIALLQEVLGPDEDYEEVLSLARRCARHRVVLKRPGKPAGTGTAADFRIPGKSAHFEVYRAVQ